MTKPILSKWAGLGNLCCGGSGGVSANPRAAELQSAAFSCKADQLNVIGGLEVAVVPCANCRTVFEGGLDETRNRSLQSGSEFNSGS